MNSQITLSQNADADLKHFIWNLAKEGFVLQLVSLAGLHSNAVGFGEPIPYFVRSIRKLLTALLYSRACPTFQVGWHARLRGDSAKQRERDWLRRPYSPKMVRRFFFDHFFDTTEYILLCRSGADYIDRILSTLASGSSSTSSRGKDSTEHSF